MNLNETDLPELIHVQANRIIDMRALLLSIEDDLKEMVDKHTAWILCHTTNGKPTFSNETSRGIELRRILSEDEDFGFSQNSIRKMKRDIAKEETQLDRYNNEFKVWRILAGRANES